MYNWVDATVNPLGGKCSHNCSYCYMKFPPFDKIEKYQGIHYVDQKELDKIAKIKNKTIFVCSATDLFANNVEWEMIQKIIGVCLCNPNNVYLLQSKNMPRLRHFLNVYRYLPSDKFIIGTTIETNRENSVVTTISCFDRVKELVLMMTSNPFLQRIISIEPILDFDVEILLRWIDDIRPKFVSIGADSKAYRHGIKLPEPGWNKVQELISGIKGLGIEVKEKDNLKRLQRKKINR